MPRQHMGLNLIRCVHSNTHHNQKSGSTKIERHVQLINQNIGQNTNRRNVNGTRKSQSCQYTINILSSIFPWPDTWNKSAGTFHIISYIHRVKVNGGIKIAEEEINVT